MPDVDVAAAKPNKETDERIEALAAELEAVKKNNQALVDEKRRETEQKQAFAEEAKKSAQELAKKNGDFDAVLKSAEEEKQKALEMLSTFQQRIASEKIANIAMQMASDIAFDADAAWILSKHIKERLKFIDEDVKVTDIKGALTVSSLDDLKKEFAGADSRFKALLKGTSASGGRPTVATGRASSQQPNPDIKLTPVQRINRAREEANK